MARNHMTVDCTKPKDEQVSYRPYTPEEEAEADARLAARRARRAAEDAKPVSQKIAESLGMSEEKVRQELSALFGIEAKDARIAELEALIAPLDGDGDGKPGGSLRA